MPSRGCHRRSGNEGRGIWLWNEPNHQPARGCPPFLPWDAPLILFPSPSQLETSCCTGRSAQSTRHQIPLLWDFHLGEEAEHWQAESSLPGKVVNAAGGALSPPPSPLPLHGELFSVPLVAAFVISLAEPPP